MWRQPRLGTKVRHIKKAKQHRDGAADTEFFIIDGGLVPLEDRLPHVKNRQA